MPKEEVVVSQHIHIWPKNGQGCWCGAKQCEFTNRWGLINTVRCQAAAVLFGRCIEHTAEPEENDE